MKKGETREQFLKRKLKELEEKREERINKYIIPIEIQLEEIRNRLGTY